MDPDATFSELLDHIGSGQYTEAFEKAGYLRDWLRGDGYYPGGGKLSSDAINNFIGWVRTKMAPRTGAP